MDKLANAIYKTAKLNININNYRQQNYGQRHTDEINRKPSLILSLLSVECWKVYRNNIFLENKYISRKIAKKLKHLQYQV